MGRITILESQNAMAYFNRGNSKFNLNDKRGACEDWHTPKDLGASYTQERIDQNCNNNFSAKILGFFNKS